jgi:hypothetical protein
MMRRKHPQVVTLAVTIPVCDVDRLEAAAGPLVLDYDTVVTDPDRRDVLILYAACGANAHDITRRIDRADVWYRLTSPAETERLCDCIGEVCVLADEDRRVRVATYV